MANSSTFVNNLPLISGLPARIRKKRPHHENGDENGGYTISHDGSQGNCSISNTGSTSPLKPKPKKRTKPQLEEKSPFQLVPCINFGSEKVVTRLFLFGSSYFGLLGGHIYPGSDNSPATLSIEAAQPCRSQATNHQCEMCPGNFFLLTIIKRHKI